jgi:hypothetical protein
MEEYVKWLEDKIEVCLEDKDLQREHWAFCQALKKYRELALPQPPVIGSFFMPDKSKVPIEMKPYNAIIILSFCREFVNEETCDDYKFQAIKEAVDELEIQLGRNLTDEHWDEINAENQVNQLIGKSPERRLK